MARYRDALPQLKDPTRLFLTDGGIETTLIFHDGLELRDFAAFDALKSPEGRAALEKYFRAYAEVAKRLGAGLILESATWRASPDCGKRLGYSGGTLAHANHKAIAMLEAIRDESAYRRKFVCADFGPQAMVDENGFHGSYEHPWTPLSKDHLPEYWTDVQDEYDYLIAGLTDDERKLIDARFREGLTLRQIGKRMGLSAERVRVREKRILEKLRERAGVEIA